MKIWKPLKRLKAGCRLRDLGARAHQDTAIGVRPSRAQQRLQRGQCQNTRVHHQAGHFCARNGRTRAPSLPVKGLSRFTRGALLTSLLLAGPLFADTITLTPVGEGELHQLDPDSNFANADSVVAGALGATASSEIRRAVLQFDLAGRIPPGAVINSATLRVVAVLRVPRSPANSIFDLRRVLAAWTVHEVTWNSRLASSLWEVPGASGSTDAASIASSSVFVTGLGVYTFQSTPALIADVQNWVNHPENNWGWLMRSEAETTQRTARHFAGQSDPANAPRLVIVFTPPSLGIIAQPLDQQVSVGGSAAFSVTASGAPPLAYQWLFNDNPLPGATTDTLRIDNVQTTNAGQYSVTVSNQTGSTNSRPATLTVLPLAPGQPFVTIVSPTNDARFPAGQAVLVTAEAGESNGTISQVEFFLNGESFGISTTNPHTRSITNVLLGTQLLTAVATDSRQIAVTSSVVRISFVGAPTVTETLSPSGTNFLIGTTLTNTALVSPGVTNVQFFANEILLTNLIAPPFVLIWTPAEPRLYSLTISATDNLGQSSTSSPLVIRIHQPDSTPPRLAITNAPANFSRLTNAAVQIEGIASDANLSYVEYQVNSGPFLQLIGQSLTAQGTSNWRAVAKLQPGNNVVRLRSIDFAGNASSVVIRSYTYVVTADLSVQINGTGSVTPQLSGRSLEVGKAYRLTARPAPGSIFVGWEGFFHTIHGLVLNFPMQSNLTIVANFTNDFRAASGQYSGLFFDTNNVLPESSGSFSLQLAPSGSFSGKLGMNGTSYPFRGQLEIDGAATVAVLRHGLPPTALGFKIERSGLETRLGGFVTNALGTNIAISELFAERKVSASSNVFFSPFILNQFNLVSAADQTAVGSGYVLLTRTGGLHIHSRLTDGRTADSTSLIFQQDFEGANLPVYLSYSGGKEIIIGLGRIDLGQQGLLSGELWQARSGTNAFPTFPNRIELSPRF